MWNFNTGRVAAFVVTGIILAFGSPPSASAKTQASSQAASSSDQKPASLSKSKHRHGVRSARRGSRHSIKSASSKSKTKTKQTEPDVAKNDVGKKSAEGNNLALPVKIANANAQMLDSDAEAAAVTNTPAPTTEKSPSADAAPDSEASRYVVPADQINDIDRAATGLPAPKPVAAAKNRDDTDLAQTSLIGRIFVAIGGLLTVGSAVRMFIA